MKFYAFLCALVALALILTPAIALIGTNKKEDTVSDTEIRSETETAIEWMNENIMTTDE